MTNFEGELQKVALPQVLESIAAIRSSGILTVQGEDDIVAISFLNGGVVAADALNQTVEEGLGAALQESEVISAENFVAAAREHQGGSSGSLGDLLVERGLISRDDLLRGLRQQTYRLMVQVLSWRRGEFKFYEGDEVSYEDGFQPLTVDEILARSLEEAASADLPELDAVYSGTTPPEPVKILGRDGDGQGAGTWLRQEQVAFLTGLDGESTAAAIADAQRLSSYESRYALYRLQQLGLLSDASGQPEPAIETRRPVAETRRPVAETRRPAEEPLPAVLEKPAAEPSLRAEIFLPPEPGDLAGIEADQEPAVPAGPPKAERWIGPALAALFLAALVWSLVPRPGSAVLGASLLPFTWQDDQRGAFERQVRQSLFLRIDRAAKIYFLVDAHYPDSLEDLAEAGLLSPADLYDPTGYPLAYTTDEVGYRIYVDTPDGSGEDLDATESITGDFLLDPQWLQLATSERAPLVLLD